MASKGFTLRLPTDLYKALKKRKKKSMTAYVVEAIQEKVARDSEEEMARDLECLAGSVDSDEFALWMKAQRKAMKHAGD
jgi:hypothetical protein